MQQHCSKYLPVDTSGPGGQVKIIPYENMVTSHVELKGNIKAFILSLDTTSTPWK